MLSIVHLYLYAWFADKKFMYQTKPFGESLNVNGLCLSENGVEDEEDLYDCVYDDDEGGEVYEDLMKVELVQPQVS